MFFNRVNEEVEGVQALAQKSQLVISWAAVSAFRRIGISSLLLALMMGGWMYYIDNIITEASEASAQRSMKSTALAKKNGLLISIGFLELCMDNAAKTSDEQLYYCERALGNFKAELSPLELELNEDIINLNAYGAMKIQLDYEVRLIENEIKYDNSPSSQEKLAETLLSWVSFITILLSILSIYCLVVY
ncbi:hypothetical protein AB4653_25160, partial [Vibrio sp. 10N.222.48.A3]